MTIYISGAPASWGVEYADNPNNPDWKTVVKEAHLAGYKAMELGPYRYMPVDINQITPVLNENDITVIAGTIFDDLVSKNNLENLKEATHNICKVVSKLPQRAKLPNQKFATPYLTIMDFSDSDKHLARDYAAGHPDKAVRLTQEEWDGMIQNITEICLIAKEYGVRPVIHPHAGGHIEFEDELEKLVQDVPYNIAGLCLDTGHLYYSKMDPEKTLRKYWDRVDYIHFKDIDLDVYEDVMMKKIQFFDACEIDQVMCPIGDGIIDYASIKNMLENEFNYEGYITIEQESNPLEAHTSLSNVKKSVDYLKSIGFEQ